MSMILLLKLILVPALIAGVTLAGRRWGPSVAGWLSAFPVVSAPILFFIALQHGSAFTAQAAVGTLSAVLAILAFGISYSWAATRFSWGLSLVGGFVGYFAAVACLNVWAPSLYAAAPVVLAALLLAPRLYPVLPESTPRSSRSSNDIVWRMGAGALLVLLVTHFSSALGPRLSGLFAMFPVMGSVLVVFSHRCSGSAFAVQLLRGMVLGYYAFSVFCIALSFALRSVSIELAFVIALSAAVLVQAISRLQLGRA
jgi:uncharacterized membrane protein (GlpM family)